MQAEDILNQLKTLANPDNVAGMAHFGINPANTLGISVPALRQMAKDIGKNHALAQQLWASGLHEARLLACFIDRPQDVTAAQMEAWVNDFDSWDVCDQCCGNLFDKTPWAYPKAIEWSARDEEFVKRAGFAMMAYLAVHDKKAPDEKFMPFLPLIQHEASDSRNFVKKAVNWALRQIGKRNPNLNHQALETARQIQQLDAPAARWVAADAIRELTNEKIQRRL